MINWKKRVLKPALAISLLAVLILAVTGCAELGLPPLQPAETDEATTEPAALPTTITTEDRAILAVYEHLLGQAESYQARDYLADFYATATKWSASSEFLQDGTSIWVVVVDMTGVGLPEDRAYWRQASWFVLQDDRIIPSNRLQTNALRIEADLQELSLQPRPAQGGNTTGAE